MSAYSTYDDVYRVCGNISTSDVAQATITSMITESDAWIEETLRKTWQTSASKTDYFDNVENSYQRSWESAGGIIIGTKPFTESRDVFELKWKPVNSITDVWILERDQSIELVYSFDTSESTYTDNTTEANSVGGTPFNAFASSVGVGDILYVGLQYKFLSLSINLVTAGVGGIIVWEYYNGSSWTTLTVTEGTTNADDLNASGKMTWTLPRDWQVTTVNSSAEKYWVRLRVTTGHSTAPTIRNLVLDNDNVIEEEIEPYDYTFDRNGRLILRDASLISDWRKLRVNYYAGRDAGSSFPNDNEEKLVRELSATVTGIRVMVYIMGGTYDDITSYSIAGKSVSKGEPYTNLRATIVELEKKKERLLMQLGQKVVFLAT